MQFWKKFGQSLYWWGSSFLNWFLFEVWALVRKFWGIDSFREIVFFWGKWESGVLQFDIGSCVILGKRFDFCV